MREEVLAKAASIPADPLVLPTSGQATYSGGVGIAYSDSASTTDDPNAVAMIGEMNMTANFTAAGGDVEGRLSGFHAGGFDVAWTGNDRDKWWQAMAYGDTSGMTAAEREAMIAAFDTPVEGELRFSGGIAPGFFAIDVSGTLNNDGKSVVIDGQGNVLFTKGEAEQATIEGYTTGDLTITEDGVEPYYGWMRGFAVKDD
ncbi:MAG: hypothetical protein CR993_07525 [Rhodobacterales bacterium]|nr:MAG: hypothetical protein CR993_07525 [Rhodobacterales bacterium]